jgi:hypothetical protein
MTDFTADYTKYASDFCDAPQAFHRFLGVAAIACAAAHRVYMPYGVKDLHPNLWMLLVGTSGDRKTSAIGITDYLLAKSGACPVLPNEFSREALMGIFTEQQRGVFIISEYSAFMGNLHKSYNEGTLGFLTDIYDVPRVYKRTTAIKGVQELRKPCANIIAATTPHYMSTSMEEWMSGWGPRFLVIPGERRSLIPVPPAPNTFLEAGLTNFLYNASQMNPTIFLLQGPAREYYIKWITGFDAQCRKSGALAKSVGTRIQGYALKFAMLLQISSRYDKWSIIKEQAPPTQPVEKEIITESSMKQGCLLVEAVFKASMKAFWDTSVGSGDFAEKKIRIVEILKSHSGAMLHTQLLRLSGFGQRVFNEVMDTLIEGGDLEVENFKAENGKVARRYVIPGEVLDDGAAAVAVVQGQDPALKTQEIGVRIPAATPINAGLVQSTEHPTSKGGNEGENPSTGSTQKPVKKPQLWE